ncbi:MAG TPA: hypothetical protein P5327_15590 [Kiritimatiellia bacterium]|nr:hypothetical protein [Kiritimatiellia bacterium]
MFAYIIDRLKEASTWRGIIGLLTAAGVTISPEMIEQIVAAGLAVMGIIGMIFRDGKAGAEVK